MKNIFNDYTPILNPFNSLGIIIEFEKEDWSKYLFSIKRERIEQFKLFLLHNGLDSKLEKDSLVALSDFFKKGILSEGEAFKNSYWASLIVDLAFYIGEYVISIEDKVFWKEPAPDPDFRYNNEIILLVNNQKIPLIRNLIMWANSLISGKFHTSGLDWFLKFQIERHLRVDSVVKENFFGYYSADNIQAYERTRENDKLEGYIADLSLKNLLVPQKNFLKIEEVASFDKEEQKKLLLLLNNKKYVSTRISIFKLWLEINNINIDVEKHEFDEFDFFFRSNLTRNFNSDLYPFIPSDTWISLWVDFLLYIVEEKRKTYPTLKWKSIKNAPSVKSIALVDSISKDRIRKHGENIFWEMFRAVPVGELSLQTEGMTIKQAIHLILDVRILGLQYEE